MIWKTYPPPSIFETFVGLLSLVGIIGSHLEGLIFIDLPAPPLFLLLLSVIPTLAYPDSYIFIVLFERFSIHCAWSMCVCAVMFCQQQSPLTSHPVLYVYVSACAYACLCMYVCMFVHVHMNQLILASDLDFKQDSLHLVLKINIYPSVFTCWFFFFCFILLFAWKSHNVKFQWNCFSLERHWQLRIPRNKIQFLVSMHILFRSFMLGWLLFLDPTIVSFYHPPLQIKIYCISWALQSFTF